MPKVMECCSKTSFPGTRNTVKMAKTIQMIVTKRGLLGQIGAPLPRAGGQDYVSSNKLPQNIAFSDASSVVKARRFMPNVRRKLGPVPGITLGSARLGSSLHQWHASARLGSFMNHFKARLGSARVEG